MAGVGREWVGVRARCGRSGSVAPEANDVWLGGLAVLCNVLWGEAAERSYLKPIN